MPHFFISGLLVLAVALTTATTDDTPPFKITTKRDSDTVGRPRRSKTAPFMSGAYSCLGSVRDC
jgi:hypothetical protein